MTDQGRRERMQGLSMVELMIALLLGSLLLIAVGNVYLGSTQSFRTQDAMARLQEGARFAFETIGFDLRQVGFGCSSVNMGPLDPSWYKNLFTRPLEGYDAGVGSPTAASAVAGTDAIRVLRADKTRETTVSGPGTTSSPHGLSANGLFVVTDYTDGTIYPAATASGTSYTKGIPIPCTATAVIDAAGLKLLPLAAHLYYIRTNPAGEPSLYRETLLPDGTTEAQELVEGVEDMQILYGEDTTQVSLAECPDDGCSADRYVEADEAAPPINWTRVVSARITLTLRTPDNVSADSSGADRRIRRTFTTTIAARNRI